MSNLINFFFSFDKLMKEKLVIAFFWLGIAHVSFEFGGRLFDNIGLDPIEAVLNFFGFFVYFLFVIVGVRLLCELMIAIFRINDHLSPDGGKSETADIDPVHEALKAAEEARRAAEDAAKKATAAGRSAVNRNRSHAADDSANQKAEVKEVKVEPMAAKPETAKPAVKTAAPKKTTSASAKPAAAKKAPAKKAAAKKAPAKKTAAAKKPSTAKPPAKKPAAKKPAAKDQPETD